MAWPHVFGTLPAGDVPASYLDDNFNAAAPLASPALTGLPTAPTAAPGTGNTQLATTAYADAAVAAVSSAPVRQTVTAGPVSTTTGLPNFLPATTANLNITTQNVTALAPFVVTSANGASASGALNLVAQAAANFTWTGLTLNRAAATPNFLYVLLASGTFTQAQTILPPIYQWGGVPAVTLGQITFNIGEMKCYLGNGATATQTYLVVVGEAATDATTVISTVAYAYNGIYDSGYTATLPAASTPVTKSHNIGLPPRLVDFRILNTTADAGWAVGDEIGMGSLSNFDGANVGVPIIGAGTNFMTVVSSAGVPWRAGNKATGVASVLTLASWKYRLIADRGW